MLCPQCGFNRQERRVKPCSISECRHEAALLAPVKLNAPVIENDLSAAMTNVVKAAKKVKMVHLSSWDCLGKGTFFQYRDTGALAKALVDLKELNTPTCPRPYRRLWENIKTIEGMVQLHEIKRRPPEDRMCIKHPGATPPCAEDACECYGRAMDLAGAYQSILDGRL